jgi:uncharacterized membrane protein YeaQ/YmgE (transglycosylase-associated protein family)
MYLNFILYILLGLTSAILLYGFFNTLGNINENVPFKKVIYQILIPLIIVLFIIVWIISNLKKDTVERKEVESQLARINTVEKSLNEVFEYLQNQKTEIINQEVQIDKVNQLLLDLLEKQKAIELVTQTDKEELKNFLLAQKIINQKYNKMEKAINILTGVIGSLLAASLIILIKYLIKRWSTT